MIVLTTGSWPEQYRPAWRNNAQKLKDREVDIYVIGTDPEIPEENLRDVASSNKNIFTSSSVENIPSVRLDLVERVLAGNFCKQNSYICFPLKFRNTVNKISEF